MRGGLLDRLERDSVEVSNESNALIARCCDYESSFALVQKHILESHPLLLSEARKKEEGRQRLRAVITQVITTEGLASGKAARDALAETILYEVTGLGPLEPLVQDDEVTEIMVNAWNEIWVERKGILSRHDACFKDSRQLYEVISRAVAPLGRRIDQSMPFVDGRLPDGSRLHACIPPISVRGPVLNIRKFSKKGFSIDDLIGMKSLTNEGGEFLRECVRSKLNLIVAGGTGSGKTSTLNALLSEIARGGERIVTIEDCAELNTRSENLVSLESRPPNIEGRGEITIRTLVRNALRMRPDRIVVGEVRGAETFDMLQAMNTGHPGSMSTVHANGAEDALRRLEGMALLAPEVPERVVAELIPMAIDVIVFQRRFGAGERKITDICLSTKERSPGGRRLTEVFAFRNGVLTAVAETLPSWFGNRAEWVDTK